ncbi:putative leucine-rich repeat receptor-like serine/threonine-protein kinase [Platanthera zijinensis]|uniref:Leucine-rich repeat receptor-like serine/threonine-protein kinase n=1 Tax=Platanthera zijinensis TaxID=2320716 RepID=A0AAP0BGX1_9ASPA
MGSKASPQGDVYSYGILLLELFTGKRPTDEMFMDGLSLREYVERSYTDNLMEIMDPSLVKDAQTRLNACQVFIYVWQFLTSRMSFRNTRLKDYCEQLGMLFRIVNLFGACVYELEFTAFLSVQVNRLAREIRQLASARPITVVNNGSGEGNNITPFLIPAATLGAVGYGYMWWKGISFSDLMYVTKRNMATAVSSMTKHLEQVSSALAATKRHLTQRIEGLDGKLDEQKLISTEIRDEVTQVRGKLDNIGFDLGSLQQMVFSMDGKMSTIERKQYWALCGPRHLHQFYILKLGAAGLLPHPRGGILPGGFGGHIPWARQHVPHQGQPPQGYPGEHDGHVGRQNGQGQGWQGLWFLRARREPQAVAKPTVTRLSWGELQARKEKGLCFNCDEKFAMKGAIRPSRYGLSDGLDRRK